jgi:flagellar biosynthesis/type III secretory pathway ATPase
VFNLCPASSARREFRGRIDRRLFTGSSRGDDFNEPICDGARHSGWTLSWRELGSAGHYPAIDILQSVSHWRRGFDAGAERRIRRFGRRWRVSALGDLINLGAYVAGSNPVLDAGDRTAAVGGVSEQDAGVKSPGKRRSGTGAAGGKL